METPVIRIGILRRTGRTHGEACHGGGGAVVGDVLDDGVARAAMGAVGEGIPVAPVGGRAKVAPAGVAGAHIRRNQRESTGLLAALKDGKPGPAASFDL